MSFTAQDVRALREKTNVGMMDCKKALVETDGDFEKAIAYLREKGLAAAAKKASRIAAEGMVATYVNDNGVAAIVEVNSETDFVSKNADFQKFVSNIAEIIVKENPTDVTTLSECSFLGTSDTVTDALREKILTIGENIQIRRFERYESDTINIPYVHMGGVVGSLVGLQVSDNLKGNAEIETLGKDIGMQIAAMRPQWLDEASVPAETIASEKEILLAQTMSEGKPEKVAEKIVIGRINKFFQENCLKNQTFVKENKISVGEYVQEVAKKLGGEISLMKFVRFEKGEGIEKKEDNFAEEVASMAK